MQLIFKKRGNGKTSDLIAMSAWMKIPIVCRFPDIVKAQAKKMHFIIPEPIAYREYIRSPGRTHGRHRVLIDELDWFLREAFDGMICECATIDMGGDFHGDDSKRT